MKRRDFIKLVGITTSASVLTSCGVEKGTEKLIPILVPPDDDYIPGEPIYYRSTCTECPANCGVTVKTRELNPIKLEGIKEHPINPMGTLCIRGQSSLMRMYQPDRIRQPLMRDENGDFRKITWKEAYNQILRALKEANQLGRKNLYFASRTTGSLSDLIDDFCKRMDVRRLPEYEVFTHANLRRAYKILFKIEDIPTYKIEKADFLLTIGADILETFLSPINYAGQLKRARENKNFRWYHVEPHASLTGFQAQQRYKVKSGSEGYLLSFLLHEVSSELPVAIKIAVPKLTVEEVAGETGLSVPQLNRLVQRLTEARNPLLVVGGVSISQANGLGIAVLAGLIQYMMGMMNSVIDFNHAENYSTVGTLLDVQNLVEHLSENKVGVLFLSRVDPLATLPKSMAFREALDRAHLRVGMGDFLTSTMKKCDVVLPLSHTYESWGDTQTRRGVIGLIQPTVEPLFDTLTEGDILLQLMHAGSGNQPGMTYRDWLFQRWKRNFGETGVDEFLKTGYRLLKVSRRRVLLNTRTVQNFLRKAGIRNENRYPLLYVVPSLRTFDGRSRVIPLLYEIPDPLTTISYGEWVSVSPKTASRLQLKDEHQVRIDLPDSSLWLAVKIQVGLPEDVFVVQRDLLPAVPLSYDSRTGEAINVLNQIKVVKTGASVHLPILSGSMKQDGRGLIPISVEEKHGEEASSREQHGHITGKESLYPKHDHPDYRWAMAIDLESCIGCSACVAACYLENNLAIVGKDEHLRGREMSWIRLEPFVRQDESLQFLVMLCQHCDQAPCEPVCPVYATYHNPEGLNVQVYNRCVGTRYCSNNCPYKVRRFNWFDHPRPDPLNRMVNPDVFLRSKGIMEKCTFCVQRIRKAKDVAKDEGRKVKDGEVMPACAQTCPTNAIVFGNIQDESSEVYRLAHSERSYHVFEHLGTQPSVYYLRKEEIHDER